jgi:hypothetical protein
MLFDLPLVSLITVAICFRSPPVLMTPVVPVGKFTGASVVVSNGAP